MFVELIDLLRCPVPHEDGWLVLAARETRDRHVLEGTLGCPVCGRDYAVRGGVADLRAAPPVADHPVGVEPKPVPGDVVPADGAAATDDETVLRLAAMAGLSEPGGTVALGGGLAAAAAPLAGAFGVVPLVVEPPAAHEPMLSALRCARVLPVAEGGLRALLLDAASAAALDLAQAATRVRPGGRMVAPAAVPLPAGVRLLARDDAWWVAEREPPRVELRRA